MMPALSCAADRYVSPTGNDAHDGLTAATALRTLAAAAKATPAGSHTIRLAAGDYPETESSLLAPGVSLVGAGIGQTVIRWSARQEPRETKAAPEVDKTAIRTENTSNASISGFSLIGNLPEDQRANTGIVVHGAHDFSIHDCEVKGFEFTGIWMHDAVGSTIRNNRLEDNGVPHKDSCSGGLQIGHLTDCTIHHNTIREHRGAYGIKTCIPEWTQRNDPWSAPKVKLVRVLIHDNDIKTRQQGGWGQGQPNISIELWHAEPDTCEVFRNRVNTCVSLVEGGTAAKTIRVHHNLFLLDPGYNYALEAGFNNMEIDNNVFRNGFYPIATFGPPPNNINVHNNVFDGIEDINLLSLTGATDFRFTNNTVVVKKDMPVLSLGKHGKESRGILIADNIFVKDNGEPQAAAMVSHSAESPPAPDAVTMRGNWFWNWNPTGADGQSADPMLIREPEGDQFLKLAPESPALKVGKGTHGGNPAAQGQ
jgi:parallel beta-helix repeat protein